MISKSTLFPLALLFFVFGLCGVLPDSLQAGLFSKSPAKLSQQLIRSADRFAQMQNQADRRIPPELIARARGIVILRKFKAGFIIGGEAGNGVALVRDARSGRWSAPAFVSAAAGSYGLQIGAQESTLVMLLMNEAGLKVLQGSGGAVGIDVAATAGPFDEGVGVSTATFNSPVLVYTSSGGLFAGAAIKGGGIMPAEKNNGIYYGRMIREILFGGAVMPDAYGQRLIQTLDAYSVRR